jgi:site-specific recombinase XerD
MTPVDRHHHVSAWLGSLSRKGLAPGTREKYGLGVDHFTAWWGMPLTEATRSDIETYLDEWHATDSPAASTQRLRLAALNSFFRFLEDRELIDRSPAERIEPPKMRRDGEIKWLRGRDDAEMLAAAYSPNERIIVWLLRWTGMRSAEARSLQIRDVDLEGSSIRIRVSKSDSGLRVVPITPELRLELERWFDRLRTRGLYRPDAPVLSTEHGTPMLGQYIWRVVKRVAKRAGVEASPHTLRRTFGSHFLNEGMRLETVSKLLGHSNVSITQAAYAQLEDSTVRDEFMRFIA